MTEALQGTAQAAVALTFVVSAAAKLSEPSALTDVFGVLRIPARLRFGALWAVSLLELTLAALLFTQSGPRAVLPAVVSLCIFTGLLAYLARAAPGTSCGCLGSIASGGPSVAMARNLLLLLLLVVAGFASVRPAALSVVVGAQLALLLLVTTEAVSLLGRLRAFRNTLRAGGVS